MVRRLISVYEPDYWVHLEYRVRHELDGLRHTAAGAYWCDGLVRCRYVLDGQSPRIHGRAWLGIVPRHQERWEYTLLLDRPFNSVEAINLALKRTRPAAAPSGILAPVLGGPVR